MSPSSYDPRRSRPRPAAIPDPEAAPIDALLGPEPAAPITDAASDHLPVSSPDSGSSRPPRPLPGPGSGAPSALVQLAPLVVIGALLAALVWWLTRRRSAES